MSGRPGASRRPAGRIQPRFQQGVERAARNLHAADRLDLGPADGLVIGDDRQRLDAGAAELARLALLAAQDVGEIGRRLEMPAPPALDQLDPPPLVQRRQPGERRPRVGDAGRLGQFARAHRAFRREQRGFERAQIVVDHARFTISGANGACWRSATRPCRASSSAATKDEAMAERR